MAEKLGIVVIGRNEGERLVTCLTSVLGRGARVVYVDSGSNDGSVETARRAGAEVLELDVSVPFTAARARNAGASQLLTGTESVEHIQFVDGDCEVVDGWLGRATMALRHDQGLAVVCGRRRERHPEASVFNLLCDIEWDTPIGPARSCGGDAMFRATAFKDAGGFRDDLIAGEEPELCFRLRAAGWRVERLDKEMTFHDANMHRVSQWWMRATRSGYAFAQNAWLHGRSPERMNVREIRRTMAWGLGLPVMVVAATLAAGPWGLALLLALPAQFLRLRFRFRALPPRRASAYAVSCALTPFPGVFGALRFHWSRIRGNRATLIEYK